MSDEGLFIDHVIYGVRDVDAAAARLWEEHGLGSVPGGTLMGGSAHRIIPLEPPTFLELLGVEDESQSDGAWLAATVAGGDRPIWWVVGTSDMATVSARRGLPVVRGEIPQQDGTVAAFQSAGMHRFPLPFFIQHSADRRDHWRRRYEAAGHRCAPGAITFVEVGEPPELLQSWLGDHDLPVRHDPGPIGIRAVGIATAGGEIVIG